MASWAVYLQWLCYIALLFFFIPLKIKGPNEIEIQFENYLTKFNKTYPDTEEYQNKLQAFTVSHYNQKIPKVNY